MTLNLSRYLKTSLTKFGFLLASKKYHLILVLKLVWLGYLLHINFGKVYVTDERISRLEVAIESFLYQMKVNGTGPMKVRLVAPVVGQIMSLRTVVAKLFSLQTRALYVCILGDLGGSGGDNAGGHSGAELLAD